MGVIGAAVLAAALLAAPTATQTPTLTAPATAPIMTGPQLPYAGKYRIKKQDTWAMCIAKRESNYHWFSTNRAGGYAGAFQFNNALKRGATWMMLPELRVMLGKDRARIVSFTLRTTPMNRWRPYWQHMAFATVLNWEAPGSGAHHWAGGRFACRLQKG